MKKIKAILKFVDLFGVPVKVLTEKADEKYQSLQGGVISVIISTLSLLYCIYMINLWVSGSIQPNVSLISKAMDFAEFNWDQSLVTFALSDFTSTIDPFSQTNNIITPLLFTVVQYKIQSPPQVVFSNPHKPQIVEIKNGSLILNNMNKVDDTYKPFQVYFLIFAKCNEKFMPENSNCASEDVIDQYLSEYHGFLSINVNLKQYNYKTNSFDTITKSLYQAISPIFPQFTELSFKIQNTIIDDGILLTNDHYFQSINDFGMINQSIDKNYVSNIVNSFSNEKQSFESITTFYLVINNVSVIQNIQLPKLNTILAQIGSILQVIFFLKYLAIYINNNLIDADLFNSIVHMYYPNMKLLTIKRNFFGKVQRAKYQNRDLNEHFFQQYNQLMDIAKQKTRLINVLYEISRIQFLLYNHFSKDQMIGCHELGSIIKFDIWQENMNRGAILPEDTLSNDILTADINLLMKSSRKYQNQIENYNF